MRMSGQYHARKSTRCASTTRLCARPWRAILGDVQCSGADPHRLTGSNRCLLPGRQAALLPGGTDEDGAVRRRPVGHPRARTGDPDLEVSLRDRSVVQRDERCHLLPLPRRRCPADEAHTFTADDATVVGMEPHPTRLLPGHREAGLLVVRFSVLFRHGFAGLCGCRPRAVRHHRGRSTRRMHRLVVAGRRVRLIGLRPRPGVRVRLKGRLRRGRWNR